jgi:hypothetical protein
MAFSREGVLVFHNFARMELGRLLRLGVVGAARLDRAIAQAARGQG